VAATLRQHPQVADAAVVALPDKRLGQVPGAAVVLADGGQAWAGDDMQAELQSWVRARQAPYAVPVTIRSVDALPRTPSMKIAKGALAELLMS